MVRVPLFWRLCSSIFCPVPRDHIVQRAYSEGKAIGTRWGSLGACSQARVYAELREYVTLVSFNQSSCQTSGSTLHVGILCCFVNCSSRVRLYSKLVYGQMWTYIRTITTPVIQLKSFVTQSEIL